MDAKIGTLWLAIGFVGQLAFGLRFVVQWIASERRGSSFVPIVFWHLSIGGGLTLLAYAIHRRDPVFVLGQITGVAIYVRNLMLIHRDRQRSAAIEYVARRL